MSDEERMHIFPAEARRGLPSPFQILETDLQYTNSSEDPTDECSRCRQPIDDDEVPLLLFPESGAYTYRYHLACAGFSS